MGLYKTVKDIFGKKEEDESVKVIRLGETASTNDYLRGYQPGVGEEMTVVVADYQTDGRGQATNHWESEAGKNLLFSVLLHPVHVPVVRRFLLSEFGAVVLKDALAHYVQEGIALKWPNDIYWNDRKLSGTLIETKLAGGRIKDCIFGVGLNVNQTVFRSDAPNPVSLCQILGREVDRDELLGRIIASFRRLYPQLLGNGYIDLPALYHDSLYRRHGSYPFIDSAGRFEGTIVEVEDDGHLVLRDREGRIRSYLFKEVEYGKI